MAGIQVILYGRFWVITEGEKCLRIESLAAARKEVKRFAQRGGEATRSVGLSGAGPWTNAVRPYIVGKILARKKKLRYCNAEVTEIRHRDRGEGPRCSPRTLCQEVRIITSIKYSVNSV